MCTIFWGGEGGGGGGGVVQDLKYEEPNKSCRLLLMHNNYIQQVTVKEFLTLKIESCPCLIFKCASLAIMSLAARC